MFSLGGLLCGKLMIWQSSKVVGKWLCSLSHECNFCTQKKKKKPEDVPVSYNEENISLIVM